MDRLDEHAAAGLSGPASTKAVKHVPLLQRGTEPAVEERLLKSRPLTANSQQWCKTCTNESPGCANDTR